MYLTARIKKIKLGYFVFCLFLSCQQREKLIVENFQFINRNFNLQDSSSAIFEQNVVCVKSSDFRLFVYGNSEGKKDSLKILNNDKAYYRGVLLKKIDFKFLDVKGIKLELNKYYFENGRDYRDDCYLFIDKNKGVIFEEYLNSGLMIEYDVEKYYNIHKNIALGRLGFENGPFEVMYAKRDYKSFK